MIRLQKKALPEEDAAWLAAQQTRFDELRTSGGTLTAYLLSAYRDPRIKRHIREETYQKCAYCEWVVEGHDHGDVEHIEPKSKFPERRYDYANLTLGCTICNNNKGDCHDPACPLLHPYDDEPAKHLVAVGPMLLERDCDRRGHLTIRQLDLNRKGLIDTRKERLENVANLIRMANGASGEIRDALLRDLCREAQPEKEYSFVVNQFLAHLGYCQ